MSPISQIEQAVSKGPFLFARAKGHNRIYEGVYANPFSKQIDKDPDKLPFLESPLALFIDHDPLVNLPPLGAIVAKSLDKFCQSTAKEFAFSASYKPENGILTLTYQKNPRITLNIDTISSPFCEPALSDKTLGTQLGKHHRHIIASCLVLPEEYLEQTQNISFGGIRFVLENHVPSPPQILDLLAIPAHYFKKIVHQAGLLQLYDLPDNTLMIMDSEFLAVSLGDRRRQMFIHIAKALSQLQPITVFQDITHKV